MARLLRADRVRASKNALAAMPPRARALAKEKAAADNRSYPTSAQRARAKRITGGR